MATGAYDAQGIWIYGEDDPASPFSDLLNLAAESTSVEIATDRARLDAVEAVHHQIVEQYSGAELIGAPIPSTAPAGYPVGLSARNATTVGGWPANGILHTWNYSTTGRTAQILTSGSTGATGSQQYLRHWGAGPGWTPWRRTDTPPESEADRLLVSFTSKVSHTVNVVFAETFSSPPRVFGNIASGDAPTAQWHARPISITTTGFTMFLFGTGGSVTWSSIPVDWHAVLDH